jgi:thiamine-monophosphate kinase
LDEATILGRLRASATHPSARGLLDDVAQVDRFIFTHDSIAEGVHYFPDDPPASVGWKLMAVNLSDLAAKGATPVGALLSLTLRGGGDDWELRFLDGIEAAAETYAMPLIGGDTIALPDSAPRVLGLTAIGRAGPAVPSRSGAQPGDQLWVVGTIGDSAAGLELLQGNAAAAGTLVDIYRRPIPMLLAGQALAPVAKAAMDISDGLLLDSRRMAEASSCAVTIDLASVPISETFASARGTGRHDLLFAATGGDDYALLVALPPTLDPFTLSLPSGTRMRRVGSFAEGSGLTLTWDGEAIDLPESLGHEHRGAVPSPMGDRP